MNLNRSFIAALALSMAWACAPGTYDQQVTQIAVTPTGAIVGRVTDWATALGLEGVKITVYAPTVLSATSDAQGHFTVPGVVVNSTVYVTFEKDGFLRSYDWVAVPGYTGNSPLADGYTTTNIWMAHADGEIQGFLSLPNGTPAVGAKVYVDQRDNGFDSVVTATTDASGNFTLTGLATAPTGIYHNVYAQWFDADGDGEADFSAASNGISVFAGTPARLFLQYNDLGQRVLHSNILDGEHSVSDPITLSFALPTVQNPRDGRGSFFRLIDDFTGQDIAFTEAWANPTDVTITPGGPLTEGHRYYVSIDGLEALGGGTMWDSVYFQVRGTTSGPSTAVTRVLVRSTLPDPTKFDHNTTTYVVSFDLQDNVTKYEVYAKDTSLFPQYVLVGEHQPGADQTKGRATKPINLSSIWGSRPLALGNSITFAVVPVDVYGNRGDLSAAMTVTVRDTIAPSNTSMAAVGTIDAINDTAAAAALTLRLNYSEPMDTTSVPTLTSVAGTIAQLFTWDTNANAGVLVLQIPAGADLTGSFVIRGGRDQAGNAISGAEFTGTLGGRKELLTNGGFQNAAGMCNLDGWTATQSGNMPATTSVAGAGLPSFGGCAALMGAPLGGAPQTGLANLTQQITLPDISMNPSWRFEYRVNYRPEFFDPSGLGSTVAQRCRINDTSDMLVQSMFSLSSQTQSTYSTAGYSTFAPVTPGQTIRVNCNLDNAGGGANPVNGALYIDDISVSLFKPTTLNL